MADVFISYAQPDRETAFHIAEFLEQQGIVCWIAPRDVPPGKDYGAAIIDGIETAKALVLVLSEHSNESGFVQKEVERAVSKAKPLLPVRIREITPSGSMEFFVSSAQWVDAWQAPIEQHLIKLADAIGAITGVSDSGRDRTAVPRARPARSGRPLLIGAGLAVLAAIVAGALIWQPWQAGWQSAPVAYLVGSWCAPMSGNATFRTDFIRTSETTIAGEVHYSHYPDVHRFRAEVEPTEIGFTLNFTEPAAFVEAGPRVYRVIDEATIAFALDESADEDERVQTRCPPDSGK